MTLSCSGGKETSPKSGYAGEEQSRETMIFRDSKTKSTVLKIETAGKWTLYAGRDTESIDFSKPVAQGDGSGTFDVAISDSLHYVFQLVTENGKALLGASHLPLESGYNFRDLGGLRTVHGKRVKWGTIFRSDDLGGLSDRDLAYLASIPLKSIVDFRSHSEIEASPDRVPESVQNRHPLSIDPGSIMGFMEKGVDAITTADAEDAMMMLYRTFVTDSACLTRFKEFFELLQDEGNAPLLYHCSAGKDRTGIATALLLSALGVDEETILEDYLLSNSYLKDKYSAIIDKFPELRAMFEVKPHYIKGTFDEIKTRHGSVEQFLKNELHVDLQKLRTLYLQ